jgi:hypothetical protein
MRKGGINVDSNGNKSYILQDEIDKINNQGFGKLFSQISFYKKGYIEFLNDFPNLDLI